MKIHVIGRLCAHIIITLLLTATLTYGSEPNQSLSDSFTQESETSPDKGAFLYLKERIGTHETYTILTPPTTIEDKEWKALYALTQPTQKNIATLAGHVEAYLKLLTQESSSQKAESTTKLIRYIFRTLAPAMKPFELYAIPVGKESYIQITFTSPCVCCKSSRYHLEQLSKPGEMRASINILSDIQASANIEAYDLQIYSEILQKGLSSVAPTLVKQHQEITQERLNILSGIFSLCHEMAHIARLDSLEQTKNPEHGFAKRVKKEIQADLIALLILRGEEYFLASINLIARFFMISFLEQVAFVLHADPDNDTLLEKLHEIHKKTEFTSLPPKVKTIFLKTKKKTYVTQLEGAGHPLHFKRIQDILTMWAAYLVHAQEKPLSVLSAIDHVAQQSIDFFKSLNIAEETILQLLTDIVNNWKKEATRQESHHQTLST